MIQERDYLKLLERARATARNNEWNEHQLGDVSSVLGNFPIFCFTRRPAEAWHTMSISAGIHGDEPAGPEAALTLLVTLPQSADLIHTSLSLVVCENPTGYALNRRENIEGIDLNRKWHLLEPTQEIAALRPYFLSQRFDLSIELHEDYESHGFYLYEICDSAPWGRAIINDLRTRGVAINEDLAIDSHPANAGVIQPLGSLEDRPEWPKAIFTYLTHRHHTLTFESGTPLALSARVEAHVQAVHKAANLLQQTPSADRAQGEQGR